MLSIALLELHQCERCLMNVAEAGRTVFLFYFFMSPLPLVFRRSLIRYVPVGRPSMTRLEMIRSSTIASWQSFCSKLSGNSTSALASTIDRASVEP